MSLQNLREQIKGALSGLINGKNIESVMDNIMNHIVQTDPNLSDMAALHQTISSLEKELHDLNKRFIELQDVNQRVSNLENYWNKLSSVLAMPAVATSNKTISSTTSVRNITDEDLSFFKNECEISEDNSLRIVTSIKNKKTGTQYKLDGNSYRINTSRGAPQKGFHKGLLYEALHQNDFPQV